MAVGIAKDASLQPGTRFERVGQPRSIWVVKRLVSLPTYPPHVDIELERDRNERRTLAVAVLRDRAQYCQL
jgi:hypothetical protein